MLTKSISYDNNEASAAAPFTANRTWLLTLDDVDATEREAFFFIQAIFAGPTGIYVAVDPGHETGVVNPVWFPYSGFIAPVRGIGVVSNGVDVYGNNILTDVSLTQTIAYGGVKVKRTT